MIDSRGLFAPGGAEVSGPGGDGALLGSITAGPTTAINGGRLLWESVAKQAGAFFTP